MRSPSNIVGGNPASFLFVVGVVAAAVVPPLPDACPWPDAIIGGVPDVIGGAGGLPCLVMKSWI